MPLHTPDRHLICHWWCRPCNRSKADSDQNATGRERYGLTEAADFQEVRYRVVKLQGLCLVQNSFLLLLGCGEYVDSHGKCQHLWCLHLREVQPRCYTSSVCPSMAFMFLTGAGRMVRWWHGWCDWIAGKPVLFGEKFSVVFNGYQS